MGRLRPLLGERQALKERYSPRMKLILCVAMFFIGTGCRGEWDIPKTVRKDPCTGQKEDKYVYLMPACMRQAPQGPKR